MLEVWELPSSGEVMAFSGANHVRTNIFIQDWPIEQVPDFKYLGCRITYQAVSYTHLDVYKRQVEFDYSMV